MMNKSKLDELATKIASLDERELVYVMARSLPGFEPYSEEPNIERSGLFLGAFSSEGGEVSVEIVAYPDLAEYGHDLGPDYGLAQRAESEARGVDYVSNVKRCLSPLHGGKISLT